MPQAVIDPPRQSHATYKASALPPSHHGWISFSKIVYFKSKLLLKHLGKNDFVEFYTKLTTVRGGGKIDNIFLLLSS